MYWNVECDCCNQKFETNTLGQTICPNCISDNEQQEMSDLLIQEFKKLNKNEVTLKGINFYFDRGFDDGYRHYYAMFISQENLINASYAKLDFQCQVLRFFDENDVEIFSTSTSSYVDKRNVDTFIIFKDENNYNLI